MNITVLQYPPAFHPTLARLNERVHALFIVGEEGVGASNNDKGRRVEPRDKLEFEVGDLSLLT